MSVRTVKAGSTDVSVTIRIIDSTDGTPETGVVFNTLGIDLWYRREGAVSVDITEATLANLTTAHADGGFLHINDGVYRLDLPDAAVADGVTGVQIGGTVTGMVVLAPYIELVDYNPYDGVRLGLTALPNAAADAAGGLAISDAGGLDLDGLNTNVSAILSDTGTDGVVVAAASKTGYALSSAGIQAIWDALTSALTTVGSVGKLLVDNINATVSSRSSHSAADVWSSATRTLTANTNLNDPTAAAIADAVLDEALSGHTTAGTLGKAVADIETDATAILEDTGTTLPATLATIDGIADDLKSGIIYGAAATGTLSTTVATTNLTGYADDQLIGRVVIWLSGACEGEATDITDYASTGGTLTFTALTTAPANADTFKIV